MTPKDVFKDFTNGRRKALGAAQMAFHLSDERAGFTRCVLIWREGSEPFFVSSWSPRETAGFYVAEMVRYGLIEPANDGTDRFVLTQFGEVIAKGYQACCKPIPKSWNLKAA